MPFKGVAVTVLCFIPLCADEPALKRREPLPECTSGYCVQQGQHIAIKFLNTLTTRNAQGDRLYLQTVFPVVVSRHVLIPVGSYIDAELMGMNRTAGRTRGRAEFYIRMGTLTLPNGVQRQLHASLEKVPEPDRKPVPSSCPLGMLAAAFTIRGSDIVIAPGTTAEIVLQDPIVFRPEEVENR